MERRSKRCIDETENMFAPVVNSMFIKAKGLQKAQQIIRQVESMVKTMKAAFRDNLQNLDWMSDVSRKAAETKLDEMVDLIGYPDSILNSTVLDQMYSGVTVKKDCYLLNTVAYSQFDRQRQSQLFFAQYNRSDW